MSHQSIEIFGAPGVGKSTLIRAEGLVSSQDLFREELASLLQQTVRRRIFIPLPRRILSAFQGSVVHRFEEKAIHAFAEEHREFLELCLLVIFNSPVSAERRIRCYKFFSQTISSWWLVEDREGLVWDESFAKLTLYMCGMAPEFSDRYFGKAVASMPKRDRYIFLDGQPEQAVAGQIQRGKYSGDMPPPERETKLGSAAKYRAMSQRLRDELRDAGHIVEERSSGIPSVGPSPS